MFKKCNIIKCLLIIAVILVCMPVTDALAASKLNLYYYTTKKNVTYTGKQAKYTYNGKAINMGNTPGILIDGTSLAPFMNVFVKSPIKLSYKYNEAKGVLTLSKNGTSLTLTAGSKKAKLNGKTVTLSLAPMKVKYKDKKVSKFLVPVRFVAETFGYKYEWNSSTSTGSITSGLQLRYNNKDVNYIGTQGKVTIDGKSVNLGGMPSIIIDNTAMLQAWKVFAKSSIGAGYKYNSSAKTVTFKLNDTTVKLTLGSKTAIVNGRSRTMDTAPLLVYNKATKKSYVMVPGSFVASYLGYDYRWDSSTKTSVITSRKPDTESNPDEADGPELSGDPMPDSVVLNWTATTGLKEEINKISSLSGATQVSSDVAQAAEISSVQKISDSSSNYEVYSINASQPFSKSVLSAEDQVLKLHINNSYTYTDTFNVTGNLIRSVSAVTNYSDLSTDIIFILSNANTGYDLALSNDKCTLYVTLYPNYITKIEAGISSGKEYVKITGVKPLNVNLTEDENYLTLDIPNTINGVGDNYLYTALDYLQSVQGISQGDGSVKILLERTSSSSYTVSATGNTYLVTFDNGTGKKKYSLNIKIPDDIFYSEITHEDHYYKNQILIKIPGNYVDFYKSNPISSTNSVVKDVSVSYKSSKTVITITTTKLQGYKLYDLNGSIGVVLGNPRDIYKNIVVLDAGHGGTDPGAIRKLNGVTINEKDINFKIMYERTQKYFNTEDSEIKAYYSRYNDTKVDLYERAAFAEKVGADLFVSLHMNANNSSSPYGTEVYYTGSNKAKTKSGLNSKTLATIFLNSLTSKLGTHKRYIADKSLAVCRANTVPAVLIELGFMSNPNDLALMTDEDFQEETAKAIYDTLCEVFSAYPTGR